MFEVIVSQRFRASHAIRTVSGEYEPLHTHDWRVELTIQGGELDASGCMVDFALVQRQLREVLNAWSDKNLNELDVFLDTLPSTEHMAKCLFEQFEPVLHEEGVELKRVAVWETDNCGAAYTR